jgi:hypothetical protein
VWFLWAAYLPVAGGTIALLIKLGVPENATVVVALAWMVAFVVAGAVHGSSKCPRCGARCFQGGFWHNSWSSSCLHCGVRLYWNDRELEK